MTDFFDNHGIWCLIFLAIFPRLTLLFGSFISGGLLWWLGWIFAPHLLVAFLAIPFFDTNPVLTVIAWVIALGGTGIEARASTSRSTK